MKFSLLILKNASIVKFIKSPLGENINNILTLKEKFKNDTVKSYIDTQDVSVGVTANILHNLKVHSLKQKVTPVSLTNLPAGVTLCESCCILTKGKTFSQNNANLNIVATYLKQRMLSISSYDECLILKTELEKLIQFYDTFNPYFSSNFLKTTVRHNLHAFESSLAFITTDAYAGEVISLKAASIKAQHENLESLKSFNKNVSTLLADFLNEYDANFGKKKILLARNLLQEIKKEFGKNYLTSDINALLKSVKPFVQNIKETPFSFSDIPENLKIPENVSSLKNFLKKEIMKQREDFIHNVFQELQTKKENHLKENQNNKLNIFVTFSENHFYETQRIKVNYQAYRESIYSLIYLHPQVNYKKKILCALSETSYSFLKEATTFKIEKVNIDSLTESEKEILWTLSKDNASMSFKEMVAIAKTI